MFTKKIDTKSKGHVVVLTKDEYKKRAKYFLRIINMDTKDNSPILTEIVNAIQKASENGKMELFDDSKHMITQEEINWVCEKE